MVQHLKRYRTIYLPVVLLVIMIGLLTTHKAIQERNLTPEGLSRNIEVVDGVKGKILSAEKVDSGYDLHFNENDKLTNVQVNEQLEVTEKTTLPIKVDLTASFLAKKDQAYYLENQNVIYYDSKDKQTLDRSVDGLTAGTDKIYYWKKDQIFTVDASTTEPKETLQTDLPVSKLFVSDQNDGLFATLNEINDFTSNVAVYKIKEDGTQKIEDFDIESISGELVSDIDLSENEKGLHLIYQTAQSHGGTLIKRGYYNLFDEGETDPQFDKIKLYDTFTNIWQQKIDNLDLVVTEEGPELYLSIRSMIKPKIESWNVYRAIPTDGKWVANHISTSNSVSNNHVFTDEGEIFWLDTKGKSSRIMAVTDNPELVAESKHFQFSDWINGFYAGMATLPYGLIILMFAAMWIAPTAMYLFCVSFWNEDAIEQSRSWVRYSAIGLFSIFQYFLLQKIFTPMFEAVSPFYLSFQWYSVIIPIALVLLSGLFTRLVKNRDWNLYQEIGYFTIFHTILVLFLISPYTV